ncbi:MAG: TPM domain-containing protein [Lachnospiraceae bacterium]|nr:TPM domain-containing protein [Lachnospiraceae bacterium]
MRNIMCKRQYKAIFVLMICMLFAMLPVKVYAEESSDSYSNAYKYVNETTGYTVIIDDQAGLLNDDEMNNLFYDMEKITAYGHVAFVTINANNSTAESYAEGYYHNKFNAESGTLFLIDMDNRKVFIFSDGDIYKTVTKAYANIITDNVYTYATNQDYYGCASKVFEQEFELLEGRKIAQPMKYISNVLLAIVIALLLNYTIVRLYASSKTPSRKELLEGIFVDKKIINPNAVFTSETKRYDPVESSSSGGGRSGGGGGGGGGHSSGGGGGHSF